MNVARCSNLGHPGWLALRAALWPHCSRGEHVAEMTGQIAQPSRYAAFVAHDDHGDAVGFAEASIRTDHVNGTGTSPVAFLEGVYVAPRARRDGCARALVAAAGTWARACGSVVYWRVEHLETALAHFESVGAARYRGPMTIGGGQAMCQVRDPWGNCIGLRGPADRSAAASADHL